ncbi:YcjX family protein [Chthonobacter rhizosphaerae]|uniref:YcjX family protein n=1 Tax=Chthonobacter rhizosphaerae TaxID=2735553 RepID=UPI0015EE9A02|nr:YcjX family protein [Chthonobacter rhizosphaerae]
MRLTSLTDEARIALDNVTDFASTLGSPALRLGVTGLARAGKTVFITALVHNLIHGGRLPMFEPVRSRRLTSAALKPQVHDEVPTFDYRGHVKKLVETRIWPESTRLISEMRLTINYESASFLGRKLGRGKLNLDIVDYPGEWLLDLPLLSKDYRAWSRETIERARYPARRSIARPWLEHLVTIDPSDPADEEVAETTHRLFSGYLAAARADAHALSMVPPGRFLMPGDLAGSPALTFAPLPVVEGGTVPKGSLWELMERRYEAYKDVVVRPFFRTHFARLDRQVVLVDVLAALNAGPAAVLDLEAALAEILASFRPGRSSWLSSVVTRRIDRILFAATKADHLHHTSHDRLEAILGRLLDAAVARASFAGAEVDVRAIAAVRATREATVRRNGEPLECILGVPQEGEVFDGRRYGGTEEIALFPGDLPEDPDVLFERVHNSIPDDASVGSAAARRAATETLVPELRFLRFRPPKLETTAEGTTLSLPHIRLDRALDFLIGDKLA